MNTAYPAFHIMTKPIGAICNLDCTYCYYLEKEKLYPQTRQFKMTDEALDSYVRQYIESQQTDAVSFAWQGGEPTLMGVDYFRKAVELQKKYANGKKIENALQTNGTLLDDEWGSFFAENRFLIGLSVDGPRELHDTYRVDKGQKPTFDRVMAGLDILKKHRVEYNTLTVVNRANSQRPLDVYRFLKEIGSGFMQFIPLVERLPDAGAKELGLDHAEPPVSGEFEKIPVTKWSVLSKDYGEFLVQIFDEWVRNDIGKTFVQIFDVSLGTWAGYGASLCVFRETCGAALVLEHNGDLYSCDHYVYPNYKLGNILNQSLGELVRSPEQIQFGDAKRDTLPQYCKSCEVKFACNGECPKHRFIKTPDGEAGLNYLCQGYKRYFNHIDPYMKTMAGLLRQNRAPAELMAMVKRDDSEKQWRDAGPNDPCPCGSGKKRKKCHGAGERSKRDF